MRRNERGHVSIPTAKQNCGLAVIALGETQPAILLRHFNSKRADLGETFEIFRRNFTGAIDLVRVDVFAQITFEFMQEIFASGAGAASASSSASRWPFPIFDVSMTAAAGFSGFALVSSAICFSGASSGLFIGAQASRRWGRRASCLVFQVF